MKYILSFLSAFLLMLSLPLQAQYITASVNGSIGASEYGVHTNGQNQETHPNGEVWYMTWDASNLYIAITSANVTEAAVIYIDADPLKPINGGSNANGNLNGYNYDGTNFASLQFRADFVCYVKNSYREYRNANGSGGWSTQTSPFGNYADDGSNLREFSIPWSAITGGGIPASFTWFGYVTSPGGYVYAEMPSANPGGFIGTSARWERYYTVSSTADLTATKPFSQDSYVFNSLTSHTGFGAIGIFDFTMNSAGYSITRASGAGGAWNISGALVIWEGTVDFGSSTETCDVNGNVEIGPIGTLTLSTAIGGDLYIGTDFVVDGTFNGNSRAVIFDGNGSLNFQSISGTGSIVIDYFRISNSSDVQLNQNVTVNSELDFQFNGTGGMLFLNANNLTLGSAAIVSNYSSNFYVASNDIGVMAKNGISTSGPFTFPIGTTTSYNPVTITHNASGSADYTMRVCDGVRSSGDCSTGNVAVSDVVDKTWFYSTNSAATPSPDITVQWNFSNELTGFNRSSCQPYQYQGSWVALGPITSASGTGPYTFDILSFPDANGTLTISSSSNLSLLLPLEFLSINSERMKNGALVEWEIADAFNVDYFEIERSTDGSNFEAAGRLPFDASLTKYSYIDPAAPQAALFYRIKAVDLDGSYLYSNISYLPAGDVHDIRVWRQSENSIAVRYPGTESGVFAEVYNVLGQQLLRKRLQAGDSRIEIPPFSGMLIVRIGNKSFLLR